MGRRLTSFLRSSTSLLSGVGILLALAAVGVVGHAAQWKIGSVIGIWKPGAEPESKDDKRADSEKQAAENGAVHFESPEAVARNGIQTATVTKRTIRIAVTANGSIEYNRKLLAHLSTRAPGNVWKVYKQVGDAVRKGDVLGLVDAAEVGRAKADFLQAFRLMTLRSNELERQRQMPGALPERGFRELENALSEARIRAFNTQQTLVNLGLPLRAEQFADLSDDEVTRRVRFLGLPEQVVRTLDPVTTTANLIPLFAPFDGVVTRCEMVEGEVVRSDQPQFSVADLRRLWVILDVRQEDMGQIGKGQRITFKPDGMPESTGVISWISTEVDEHTRTVRVRAEVDNTGGQLRAHSFGLGQIFVTERSQALTVPSAAVQSEGAEPRVFVRGDDGLTFAPRPVRVGVRNHDYTEIVDGLRPGEIVVTTGSHLLKSAGFKSDAD
jgi:cobalt-zinc-cadmium efflux system membrane fusion protein